MEGSLFRGDPEKRRIYRESKIPLRELAKDLDETYVRGLMKKAELIRDIENAGWPTGDEEGEAEACEQIAQRHDIGAEHVSAISILKTEGPKTLH